MTSLGVKVANPNVPVVSVTGDGGFLFGVMELASAVQENIGTIVIVFNNSSYGGIDFAGRNEDAFDLIPHFPLF